MIVIIDYGMGNVGSVKNALLFLKQEFLISNKKEDIAASSHLILPGVGAFAEGMEALEKFGLVEILGKQVLEQKKPFLGICLGMELLAATGTEGGLHEGLGWVKGQVRRFQIDEKTYPVPHIGWNDVTVPRDSVLFQDTEPNIFYFVHSYHFVAEEDARLAMGEYGEPFAAAIEKNNIFGVQFHPEKSQKSGLKVLENFLSHA